MMIDVPGPLDMEVVLTAGLLRFIIFVATCTWIDGRWGTFWPFYSGHSLPSFSLFVIQTPLNTTLRERCSTVESLLCFAPATSSFAGEEAKRLFRRNGRLSLAGRLPRIDRWRAHPPMSPRHLHIPTALPVIMLMERIKRVMHWRSEEVKNRRDIRVGQNIVNKGHRRSNIINKTRHRFPVTTQGLCGTSLASPSTIRMVISYATLIRWIWSRRSSTTISPNIGEDKHPPHFFLL